MLKLRMPFSNTKASLYPLASALSYYNVPVLLLSINYSSRDFEEVYGLYIGYSAGLRVIRNAVAHVLVFFV